MSSPASEAPAGPWAGTPKRDARKRLALVVLVALVCRLAVFAAALADSSRVLSPPDSSEYLTIARHLAVGDGFTQSVTAPYRPDLRRTPIYPLLLAVVFLVAGPSPHAAALVSIAAGTAAAAATYLLTLRLFGATAALAAGLLLALDVTSISYSVLVLTEATFTVLLVGAVLLLLRRPLTNRDALSGGAALGCAMLCRPIGFALAPALLPLWTWRPDTLRAGARTYALLNVGFAIVAAAWIARNVVVAGVPTLSTIGAVNLYFHRAAAIEARLQNRDVESVRDEWQREFDATAASWSEARKIAWLTERARAIIAAHPDVYVSASSAGVMRMAAPDASELRRSLGLTAGSLSSRLIDAFAAVQLAVVYLAAAIGTWISVRRSDLRRAALVPLTLIAYFVFVSGPEVYARFRVPIMPFVAALGGVVTSLKSQVAGLKPQVRRIR